MPTSKSGEVHPILSGELSFCAVYFWWWFSKYVVVFLCIYGLSGDVCVNVFGVMISVVWYRDGVKYCSVVFVGCCAYVSWRGCVFSE